MTKVFASSGLSMSDGCWESESVCMISVSRLCVCVCVCVCVCAQPAVSLNRPTCLVPPAIHSLCGNVQQPADIKRSAVKRRGEGDGGEGGVIKCYDPRGAADCGRRSPLITPPRLPLTACVQRGESEGRAAPGFEEERESRGLGPVR